MHKEGLIDELDSIKRIKSEDIEVYLFPKNVSAKISYGDISKEVKEKTILKATRNENRIIEKRRAATRRK